MATVLLRRSADTAPSADEAEGLVQSMNAEVVHRSGRNMLVQLDSDSAVETLRGRLHGWVVSPQGATIPVPDARLKIRSGP